MALKIYEETVKTGTKRVAEIAETPAGSYLRLAVTLPKLRQGTTKKIERAVQNYGYRAVIKESMPLAIPSRKNPGEAIVFPNIKCKWTAEQAAEYLNGILSDDRTKVRLETKERSTKLALKRETTTFARLLAEHTNLKELGYRDDHIRDAADKLIATFGKAKLVECKTPRDCYEAFKTANGSCMTVGSEYFGAFSSETWVTVADDTGFYPSSWYLYHPYAKLCYIEIGGVPKARFMMYREDITKDEWPTYGDIKSCGTEFSNIVHDQMKKLGKTQQVNLVKTIAPYRIPAVFHELLKGGTVPHCPIANCDLQVKDFAVMYDEEAKEFLFDASKNLPDGLLITDTYAHRGWINGELVPKMKKSVKPKEKPEEKKPVEPEAAPIKAPVIGGAPAGAAEEIKLVKEVKPRARKKKEPVAEVAVPVKEAKAKKKAAAPVKDEELPDYIIKVG